MLIVEFSKTRETWRRKARGTVKCQPVARELRHYGILAFHSVFLFIEDNTMNGYTTIHEIAKRWEVSDRRVNVLCAEGRIEGAVKFGNTWAIPEDAEKPADARVKSGKYVKNKGK